MRTVAFVAAALLALSFVSVLPGAEARSLACTDTTHSTCPGYVCVDTSLDGRYQWNECEPRYCTCDPQPTPW